jgi:thiol-disulfide isomerase/thioredoxin
MKKNLKPVLYIVLYALFGIWYIKGNPQSDYYLYYTIALFINVGLLFGLTRYYIVPKLSNKQLYTSLFILTTGLAFSFLTPAYLYSAYLSDVIDGQNRSLLQPMVVKEVLPFLVLTVFIGLSALINLRKPIIKKAALYLGVGVVVLIATLMVKYVIDTRYKGNESIHFMENDFSTIHDILNQQPFKDKIVYIDLWFSSCGPCIQEFKKLPALKEQLKNLDVEYLYLARETSHPNSKQLWKNAIKKHNLQGWHVYMTDELKENLWDLLNKKTGVTQAYPHYMLVNRSNEIILYDASSPSEKEKIVEEIKNLQ